MLWTTSRPSCQICLYLVLWLAQMLPRCVAFRQPWLAAILCCTGGVMPADLQVHWLRVMLDEGHMLGASLSMTNKLQMACALKAERRWVMTGTPVPQGPQAATVAHLQPLLAFLHHQHYGIKRHSWEVRPLFSLDQAVGPACTCLLAKTLQMVHPPARPHADQYCQLALLCSFLEPLL